MINPFYSPDDNPKKSSNQLVWGIVILFIISMFLISGMVLSMYHQNASLKNQALTLAGSPR